MVCPTKPWFTEAFCLPGTKVSSPLGGTRRSNSTAAPPGWSAGGSMTPMLSSPAGAGAGLDGCAVSAPVVGLCGEVEHGGAHQDK